MKFIGKLVTAIVVLGLMACAGINTAIHIKSGEAKNLFKNGSQIEAPATPDQNEENPGAEQTPGAEEKPGTDEKQEESENPGTSEDEKTPEVKDESTQDVETPENK